MRLPKAILPCFCCIVASSGCVIHYDIIKLLENPKAHATKPLWRHNGGQEFNLGMVKRYRDSCDNKKWIISSQASIVLWKKVQRLDGDGSLLKRGLRYSLLPGRCFARGPINKSKGWVPRSLRLMVLCLCDET